MCSRRTNIRHQPVKEIEAYLADIAQHMRSGRAVVMVGSGFSLNADSKMPQWKDLAEEFYKETGDAKHVQTDVLNLAEEVESISGRGRLNDILETRAETNKPPSIFHKRLLGLKWADVFTTNYDTLLERTLPTILTRKYSVVVNKNELPFQAKPRIIKLHGSFPLKNIRDAKKPYIITREDYRTYPNDNAPLINTFRQALLENVVCLIGFSGEDPNFLEWIGWVRDQLSKSGPNIYLINPSPMRRAQKKLFDRRNIKVLNLSGYKGVKEGNHSEALDKFFGYLERNTSEDVIWKDVKDFPWELHDTNRTKTFEGVKKAFASLEKQYPGWLIAPFDYQERLRHHVLFGVRDMAQWPDEEWLKCDVDFWHSLASIVRQCWIPLAYIGSFLKRIEEDLRSFLSRGEYGRLASKWVDIAHDLLFSYRYCGKETEWRSLIALLESKRNMLYDSKDKRIDVEWLKFQMARGQIGDLKKDINELTVDSADIWAKCQKVALLAEFVDPNMAGKLAMRTLDELRRGMTSNKARDYKLMSYESLLLFYNNLLSKGEGIETSISGDKRHYDASTRQFQLKVDNCDILVPIARMAESIAHKWGQSSDKSNEFSARKKYVVPGFSWHAQEVPRAASFLMMLDYVGIPLRIKRSPVARDELQKALSDAEVPNSYRMSLLLRNLDCKVSAGTFSREFLLQMTREDIVAAFDEVVLLCKTYLLENGESVSFVQSWLLLLGRMFSRITNNKRSEAVEVIKIAYASLTVWDDSNTLKEVVKLLVESSTIEEIAQLIVSFSSCEHKFEQRKDLNGFDRSEHPTVTIWECLDEASRLLLREKLKSLPTEPLVDNLIDYLKSSETVPKKQAWYLAPLVVLISCNACTDKQKAKILPRLITLLVGLENSSHIQFDVGGAAQVLKDDDSFKGFQRQSLKGFLEHISRSLNVEYDINAFRRIGTIGAFQFLLAKDYAIVLDMLDRYLKQKLAQLDGREKLSLDGYFEHITTNIYYEVNGTLLTARTWFEESAFLPLLSEKITGISKSFEAYNMPHLAFLVVGDGSECWTDGKLRRLQRSMRLAFSSVKDYDSLDASQALCFCIANDLKKIGFCVWSQFIEELSAWIPLKNIHHIESLIKALIRHYGLAKNYSGVFAAIKERLRLVLRECDYQNHNQWDFESKVSARTYAAKLAGIIFAAEGNGSGSIVEEWKLLADNENEFNEVRVAWRSGNEFVSLLRQNHKILK